MMYISVKVAPPTLSGKMDLQSNRVFRRLLNHSINKIFVTYYQRLDFRVLKKKYAISLIFATYFLLLQTKCL